MSPCNCHQPPPPVKPGPVEYLPSRTYPDVFPYMYWGGAPMHRCECGPWAPVAPWRPRPPYRYVGPEAEPDCSACPPKIYRNRPDVTVLPGDHVTVDRSEDYDGTEFTVNAMPFAVSVDPESADAVYGDGTPGDPLGVYEFGTERGKPGVVPGASAQEEGLFLRGDGEWADPKGFSVCDAHRMATWLQEVRNGQ